MAAHNAGMTPTLLRVLIQKDEMLAEEVSDALELFKDAIRLTVLERATTGRSDAMLKLAAEAFVPESFKAVPQSAQLKARPTVLTVRSFEEAEEATADAAEASPTAESRPPMRENMRVTVAVFEEPPEEPKAPPAIDYYRGL